MASCETPLERRRSVSLEGVRATGRTLVGVREEVRARERTCCAVVAFIECVCSSRESAAACCAVKGDDGFG